MVGFFASTHVGVGTHIGYGQHWLSQLVCVYYLRLCNVTTPYSGVRYPLMKVQHVVRTLHNINDFA